MDKYKWRVAGGRYLPPPLVFAIINLTPDSFYDGGACKNVEQTMLRCRAMAEQGVHGLDLGAESTRPGSSALPPAEEWKRLEQTLKAAFALKKDYPELALSVDTYNSDTAGKALENGTDIINDVSAFSFDARLKDVLLEHRPGYVLMHSKGRPETMQDAPRYADVVSEIKTFFSAKMDELLAGGFPEENIILDPGIGFGKNLAHNLAILNNLEEFCSLGRPLYIGLSNKSIFGDLLGLKVDERECATQAATAILATRKIYAHRVHNARDTLNTLKIAEFLCPPDA